MAGTELSDSEIKAEIMYRLDRKGCWGARYFPVDTLVNWLGRNIKRNGKRVSNLIKVLVREEYILLHKKGDTISLNPRLSKEITEYIAKNIKQWSQSKRTARV